jgi:hypothetical protein
VQLQLSIPCRLYRWVTGRELLSSCVVSDAKPGHNIAGLSRAIVSKRWACLARVRSQLFCALAIFDAACCIYLQDTVSIRKIALIRIPDVVQWKKSARFMLLR